MCVSMYVYVYVLEPAINKPFSAPRDVPAGGSHCQCSGCTLLYVNKFYNSCKYKLCVYSWVKKSFALKQGFLSFWHADPFWLRKITTDPTSLLT